MSSPENNSAFVPVYDAIPEKWEESRQFLTEKLKEISNGVNARVVGYYSDSEYATGIQFLPNASEPQEFQSVLRKVINCSPLAIGAQTFAHGITVDANFTLTNLYGAATDAVGFTAVPFPGGANTLTMDVTNIIINSSAAYTRCYVVVEYLGAT